MKNNTSLSFWQLISKISKIEIPIIQRDYAQGRDNEKTNKIRARFLGNLINAIVKDNGALELDFVYGNIEKNIFQPLDGQQRLTTLFLLHWYVALKQEELDDETKNTLVKFTYETRISSREFCKELVKKGNNLGEGESISKQIKDSTWFFLSWEKDPTIKAMLKMLDDIENKLKEQDLSRIWARLTNEKQPPVTFHFIELKDIGLTDDLYIKMNARGKELTDFENFKALFKKHIEKHIDEWEEGKGITISPDTFSHKIDTSWTDLFWKYKDKDNQIDNKIINFIARIAINRYAQKTEIQENKERETIVRNELKKSKGEPVTDESVKRERIEQRIGKLFNNPHDVSPEDFPTKPAFEYLIECFNIYSEKENDKLLPNNLPLWDHCTTDEKANAKLKTSLFTEFIKDDTTPTYKQRVLFFAQTQYLLNGTETEFSQESFSDWLRVVRNIVENSTINSTSTFIGAIGLIAEILAGCKDIYKYLSKENIKSNFASDQIKEEILKSKIILVSDDNKKTIFETEDTNFCKGKISFPLYCIGFEKAGDIFNEKALSDIKKVIYCHLSGKNISNDFRRGLFTTGKNDFYEYYGYSRSFSTDSFRKCLIKNSLELKEKFTEGHYRDHLRDLLLQLCEKTLDKIIDDYTCPEEMPNWKKRLIKDSSLLHPNYPPPYFFGIAKDDNDKEVCYLFNNKKRPGNRSQCEKID